MSAAAARNTHFAAEVDELAARAGLDVRRGAVGHGAAHRLDARVGQVELARELDDVVVHVCGVSRYQTRDRAP